jgi:hypothetical protein
MKVQSQQMPKSHKKVNNAKHRDMFLGVPIDPQFAVQTTPENANKKRQQETVMCILRKQTSCRQVKKGVSWNDRA